MFKFVLGIVCCYLVCVVLPNYNQNKSTSAFSKNTSTFTFTETPEILNKVKDISIDGLRHLLDAIDEIETSNGELVGDNGNAIGPYQIWESYWKDAVEFDSSLGGSYLDCYNRDYSERVMIAYWKRYATENRLGKMPSYQDLARIHNGGPNGWRRGSTVSYWKRIRQQLNK